ncbi:MAG: PorV/PorQ family protein, partial [Candidatus Goldbacteria bacterium]|nr:PorV/PorQ family protein [Candidatus Goldiibacteriota bacterium]
MRKYNYQLWKIVNNLKFRIYNLGFRKQKNKKNIFLLLFFILTLCSYAAVGDYGTESIFSIGTGARALAMGGAFSALADDSTACFYNPAGLQNNERQQISFLHYPLLADTLYNSISYAYPILDFGAIGVAIYRIGTINIETYDSYDFALTTVNYEQYKATIAYANKLSELCIIGIGVNVISLNLLNVNAYGFGADIGLIYEPFKFISAALVARNILNPSLTLKTTEEELPREYIAGVAFKIQIKPVNIHMTSDVVLPEDKNLKIKTGIEFIGFDLLSIRAGYDSDAVCFGGGIKYSGLSIDYAYLVNEYFGGLSRFSVSYSFGLTLEEQKIEREKALKEQVKKIIEQEFKKKELARAKEYFDKAFSLYKEGNYDAALEELDRAFEWNDDYEDAKQLKGFIVKKLVDKYYNRGVEYYSKGEYVAAYENFKNVAEVDINYKDTKNYLALIDKKIKLTGDLKEYFSKGVELYVNRKYEDALEIFTKAAKLAPDNTMIKTYLNKTKAQITKVSGGKKLT